jgi:hypothetical protein
MYKPKLNLTKDLEHVYSTHRSGWSYAVQSLRDLHNPDGTFVVSFLSRYFAWGTSVGEARSKTPTPIEEPWIAVAHVPFNKLPLEYYAKRNTNFLELKKTDIWKHSAKNCKGIYCLSEYMAKQLRVHIDIPVEVIYHPTEFPTNKWTPEKFRSNPNKSVIQLGNWMRRMSAIFNIDSPYQRVIVNAGSSKKDVLELMDKMGEAYIADEDIIYQDDFLDNDEYDELLAKNIVFINLYDASANNAIIECIARNTPILINPIEPVIEYLGENYPYYYTTYEEAARKLRDEKCIMDTYYHLVNMDKIRFTGEYFKQSIEKSEIYKNLP